MRLFLLAALALSSLPGQPKDLNLDRDADGFGNIKWGTTVADAKAAFPGLQEAERSELTKGAFEERLIQPVLMIGSVEMTVSVQTKADSDQISRIVLKLAPFVPHRKAAFQFLSKNLIQKYGKPSQHSNAARSRMKEETEVWLLPSTTITLSWRKEAVGKLRLLDITYEAAGKFLSPSLDLVRYSDKQPQFLCLTMAGTAYESSKFLQEFEEVALFGIAAPHAVLVSGIRVSGLSHI